MNRKNDIPREFRSRFPQDPLADKTFCTLPELRRMELLESAGVEASAADTLSLLYDLPIAPDKF